MNPLKFIARHILKVWSYSGILPGLAHKYVDQYSHILHNKPLIRNIRGGSKMVCELNDHVQSRIYFFGAYEPIEAYLTYNLINEHSTIIDAGANVGFYSLLLASKKAHIYAFEPVPENFQKLKNNIQLSHFTNYITSENRGLWSEATTLTFSLDKSMANNLGSYTTSKVDNTVKKIECKTTTLDNYAEMKNMKNIDFIKMDIEGAELFALRGAQKILERHQPNILLEVNRNACVSSGYTPADLWSFLEPLGYKFFQVSSLSQNSGFINSFDHIQQANVFCLNKKSVENFSTDWDYRFVKRFFQA